MGSYSNLVKPNEPGAKKRFGQHFLRDTGVLNRIVRWIEPRPEDLFVEIGAGLGAMSVHLAPRVARLLAIEVDMDCIPALEQTLAPFDSATIVQGDVLQLDFSELVREQLPPDLRLRVAGNLPYNIATVIIERLLRSDTAIHDMSFMVQLEVAERITAHPCSREYGYLSVACQHRAHVELGFKVSSACFVPRPKVSSAMVALRPKGGDADPVLEEHFEALAKAAFGHRRKTIANSLSKSPVFGTVAGRLLTAAAIDGRRRAEELSVAEYERLAGVYAILKANGL